MPFNESKVGQTKVKEIWVRIIYLNKICLHFSLKWSEVKSLSCVQLFATPWTAAHQPSLSFTISQSWLKFMSIESVMPSNHLILCHPLLLLPSIFPSIRFFFPMSQLFASGGQSIGASASASVLPMNIQGWFPLGLTGFWTSFPDSSNGKESAYNAGESESEVAQLCPTFCNPVDCSLPGSSVHGILQARLLE